MPIWSSSSRSTLPMPVERILERGSLLHQLLGLLRIVPEVGVFGELVQLRETRSGCIDVKDASSAARLTA